MCFGHIFKPFVRKVVMIIINDIQQEATFVCNLFAKFNLTV